MHETLSSRVVRMTSDEHVCQVDIAFKCKTKDGMLYTLDITECRREDTPENFAFSEWIDSNVIEDLLHYLELVEKEDGFYFSTYESVLIRKSEIVRVWADIDCAHYGDGAQII